MTRSIARRATIAGLIGVALAGGGLATASAAHAATGTAATRTILSTTPSAPVAGKPVNLRAVVRPVSAGVAPTGTVTFLEGSTVLGTATATAQTNGDGLARLAHVFPVGNHTLTARYEGNTTYASSTSLPVTISVAAGPTKTVLTATSSPTPAVTGQKVFLRAVVKSSGGAPTGSVSFLDGTNTIGTASLVTSANGSQVATLSIGFGAGTHSLTAHYAGDGTYPASTSTAVSLTVGKAATLSTLTEAATPTRGNYAVSVAVKAVKPGAGVPTGTVTIQVDSLAPQSFALSSTGHAKLVVALAKGSHTAHVTYAGSLNYFGSSASLSFTVS